MRAVLFSSTLVTNIPNLITDHFLHPRNVGDLNDAADASGEACSIDCGAVVRLSLQIDAASQKITRANFKAAGCRYLIAAASATTELITDMPLNEATSFSTQAIHTYFAGLPNEKMRCAALCCEALATSLAEYYHAAREEWSGEEAIICVCFGVAEKRIEAVIRAQELRTIEAITNACNAGAGCRSCHPLIEDILEDYWRTRNAQEQFFAAETIDHAATSDS
ncbi:MAG: iron-sulfur cluster assembly scaffold protein [Pyrinomonadaceae bacterium]